MNCSLQIRMNISAEAFGRLPDNPCPKGFCLRTLRPGDELRLPELMDSPFPPSDVPQEVST